MSEATPPDPPTPADQRPFVPVGDRTALARSPASVDRVESSCGLSARYEFSRRGVAGPLQWEFVRELTEADIPRLEMALASPEITSARPSPTTLRHAHHQLARLVALGRPIGEIALITGYSPAYIRRMQADPAFAELCSHYVGHQDELWADLRKRLRELKLTASEILLERLSGNPDDWTAGQLMELMKLLPGDANASAGGGSQAAVNINITPVDSTHKGMTIELGKESVKEITR